MASPTVHGLGRYHEPMSCLARPQNHHDARAARLVAGNHGASDVHRHCPGYSLIWATRLNSRVGKRIRTVISVNLRFLSR